MWIELLLVVLALFLWLYWYVTKDFGYFKKHGIPEEPGSFPFGSEAAWGIWTEGKCLFKVLDKSNIKYHDEKMYGTYHFGSRGLVIRDLELAKNVIVKDADHFIESLNFGIPYKEATTDIDKVFALMLSNMKGEEWKKGDVIKRFLWSDKTF